jgi:hypothetical protein
VENPRLQLYDPAFQNLLPLFLYNFPQILDSMLSFPDERNCGIKIISQFKGDSIHAAEEIQCGI